jgi:hypothetical protein
MKLRWELLYYKREEKRKRKGKKTGIAVMCLRNRFLYKLASLAG